MLKQILNSLGIFWINYLVTVLSKGGDEKSLL